jgi:uncharacterized glyoxalase superfamily metalloenzyme YdcJ
LNEPILFPDGAGGHAPGRHLARFGEIEQRGVALTPKGRALYDAALAAPDRFAALPDDWTALREQGLAYFRQRHADDGTIAYDPIVYEDFLPVSAAGIFQSNLGGEARSTYEGASSRAAFEAALGRPVIDEFALYEAQQQASIDALDQTTLR